MTNLTEEWRKMNGKGITFDLHANNVAHGNIDSIISGIRTVQTLKTLQISELYILLHLNIIKASHMGYCM